MMKLAVKVKGCLVFLACLLASIASAQDSSFKSALLIGYDHLPIMKFQVDDHLMMDDPVLSNEKSYLGTLGYQFTTKHYRFQTLLRLYNPRRNQVNYGASIVLGRNIVETEKITINWALCSTFDYDEFKVRKTYDYPLPGYRTTKYAFYEIERTNLFVSTGLCCAAKITDKFSLLVSSYVGPGFHSWKSTYVFIEWGPNHITQVEPRMDNDYLTLQSSIALSYNLK